MVSGELITWQRRISHSSHLLEDAFSHRSTGWKKRNWPSEAWQVDLPMHSQSANRRKFKLKYIKLGLFLLFNHVKPSNLAPISRMWWWRWSGHAKLFAAVGRHSLSNSLPSSPKWNFERCVRALAQVFIISLHRHHKSTSRHQEAVR